jgi:hypothetical protein
MQSVLNVLEISLSFTGKAIKWLFKHIVRCMLGAQKTAMQKCRIRNKTFYKNLKCTHIPLFF